MKRYTWLSIIFFLSIQAVVLVQPESLFNGKDLSGWEIYGTEKWYVENGVLVCESGPDQEYGYLGTEKEYKDFENTSGKQQSGNLVKRA